MPVAHGDEAAGVEIGCERGFESARLKFGEPTDRRLAADGVVMFANDSGAAMGDPPSERTARQPSAKKIDDVGIAEKIVEERFDGLRRIGAAELKENDTDAGFSH